MIQFSHIFVPRSFWLLCISLFWNSSLLSYSSFSLSDSKLISYFYNSLICSVWLSTVCSSRFLSFYCWAASASSYSYFCFKVSLALCLSLWIFKAFWTSPWSSVTWAYQAALSFSNASLSTWNWSWSCWVDSCIWTFALLYFCLNFDSNSCISCCFSAYCEPWSGTC